MAIASHREATPKPEPPTPIPTVAVTTKVEPPPVREIAPKAELFPEAQPKEEFKDLGEFERDRQPKTRPLLPSSSRNLLPPKET